MSTTNLCGLKQPYFGVQHAIVCSSGTAALHLAYASAGINHESLGIVPAITFAATANALRYQSANILICDVEPDTGLISIESLDHCLSGVSEEQKEKILSRNVLIATGFEQKSKTSSKNKSWVSKYWKKRTRVYFASNNS